MNTYTSRNEAIEREIVDVLNYSFASETTAADLDDLDIDGIADEVLTTVGQGTTYRYMVDEDADFWDAVARHAR